MRTEAVCARVDERCSSRPPSRCRRFLAGLALADGSFGTDQVGQDNGRGLLLPTNQRITPVGERYLVDAGRLLSSTISPDGTKLAALTHIEASMVTIVDLTTGKVMQQVGLGQGDDNLAADGPLYSADGSTLWVPQAADILRYTVLANGLLDPNPTTISLTDPKTGADDLPSGMALSPDGSKLYVALNGTNALGIIDTSNNTLVGQIQVGNAPRQVVLVGNRAFVSDSRVMEGKETGPLDVPKGAYTYADIPSLNQIDEHAYPMFDLDIPDQYRVDIWQKSFAAAVADNSVAGLNMLWVPDDHTATTPEDPPPVAEVADNDLAVGRIVDTISHSPIWSSSAIFIAEDDSQAGVDHVDGHRAPFYLISPYAKRGLLDSTYYTQLNIVRTIEAILGLPPMNQEDRAAVPMTDAFTNTPDLTPYTALPENVPLNLGVDPTQAGYEPPSAGPTALAALAAWRVPATTQAIAQAWYRWGTAQHFGGLTPKADLANPAQLNRFDWYSATGWTRPYPGDSRILTPDQVPGRFAPSGEVGDS